MQMQMQMQTPWHASTCSAWAMNWAEKKKTVTSWLRNFLVDLVLSKRNIEMWWNGPVKMAKESRCVWVRWKQKITLSRGKICNPNTTAPKNTYIAAKKALKRANLMCFKSVRVDLLSAFDGFQMAHISNWTHLSQPLKLSHKTQLYFTIHARIRSECDL